MPVTYTKSAIEVYTMLTAYGAGAVMTWGVISSANRVTGTNYTYTAAASLLWPAWWLGLGVDAHN